MKKASKKIISYFPYLEKFIPNNESVLLEQQTLDKLNDTEKVFLKLIWFFEKPTQNNFNLYDLLQYIDKDWLPFALECIVTFFYKDNYFENNRNFSIITNDTEYLNQANFTKYLNEHKDAHEKKFSRAMLNTYLNRGIIPEPDLEIAGTKYWLKETCEKYLKEISIDKIKVVKQD